MPITATYHPPISEFINKDLIPGDLAFLESAVESFLENVRYRNFLVNASAYNDVKAYAFELVVQELSQDIPGTGIELVLFEGEAGQSFIPIRLETRWKILRYVHQFNPDSFAATARAFFDLLLEMADTSPAEFLQAIAEIFIADPNPVAALVQQIRDMISEYDQGNISLDDPANEIKTHVTAILASLDQLVLDIQDPIQAAFPFSTAVEHIETVIEALSDTINVELDLFQLAYASISQGLSGFDDKILQLQQLFGELLGEFTWSDVESLIVPQFEVSVTNINAAIRFPRKWLRPTRYNSLTDAYEEYKLADWKIDKGDTNALEADMKSALKFQIGSATYSTTSGFNFDAAVSVNLEKSLIADTGLAITLTNVKPDFSRTENLPEATAAGYPNDFVGAYVQFASIELPAKWFKKQQDDNPGDVTLGIIGRDMLLGTGGITGQFSLEAVKAVYDSNAPGSTRYEEPALGDPSPPDTELLFVLGKAPDNSSDPRKGFALGFKSFDLTLQQGAFIDTNILANLYIPKFEGEPIEVSMSLDHDGDFDITAKLPNPPALPSPNVDNLPREAALGHLYIKDLFAFDLDTLSVGKDDSLVYLEVSGSIIFTNSLIETIIEDPIFLKKLRINSDGSFEIEGGSIPLSKNQEIKIGPAKISITAIHCGTMERGGKAYKYWGFDGGLSINPGGVDARGDGIKFCYDPDNVSDWFLHIEGIGINLVIPGSVPKEEAAVLIQGYLSLKDPVYQGSIALQMPKMKIAGGASMKYDTEAPAFIIDAWLELPKAIPLASTGLGIYGFRGLFGMRYVASRTASSLGLNEESSWFDWYTAPTLGVNVDKFVTPDEMPPGTQVKNPFTIGAGVSLATLPDSGKTFSAKLMLLISIPTLILLDGRANVLGDRVGLTDEDPPFWAFISFSPTDRSIELGIGADYKLPKETGRILDLQAAIEAGFFFENSSAWYLYFGRKDKPIAARLLSLFDAYAYLMLSAKGIDTGAGVHFEFSKEYLGVVKVHATAFFDVWGYVSFERPQVGGGIAIGGSLDVKLFGFGLNISLAAILTVEASTPFRVAGSAEVCAGVNLRIKKIEKCFKVEFEWIKSDHVNLDAVPVLIDPNAPNTNPNGPENTPPVIAVHMQSGRTYPDGVVFGPGVVSNAQIAAKTPIPLDTFIDFQFLKPVKPANVANLIGGFGNAPRGDIEMIPPKSAARRVKHSYSLESLKLEVFDDINGIWVPYDPYRALAPEALMDPSQVQMLDDKKIGFWQKADLTYNKIRFLAQDPFSYAHPVGGYETEGMGLDAHTIFCEEPAKLRNCVKWEHIGESKSWMATNGIHVRKNLFYEVIGQDGSFERTVNPFGIQQSLAIPEGGEIRLWFGEKVNDVSLKLGTCVKEVTVIFEKRVFSSNGAAEGTLDFDYISGASEFVEIANTRLVKSRSELAFPIDYQGENIDRIRIVPAANNPQMHEFTNFINALASDYILRLRAKGQHDIADMLVRLISQVLEQLSEYMGQVCRAEPKQDREDLHDAINNIEQDRDDIKEQLATLKEDYDCACTGDTNQFDDILRAIETQAKHPKSISGLSDLDLKDCEQTVLLNEAIAQAKALEQMRSELAKRSEDAANKIKNALKASREDCDQIASEIEVLQISLNKLNEQAALAEQALHQTGNTASDDGAARKVYKCGCATFIHEVCWMTEADAEFNQSIPTQAENEDDFTAMAEAINHVIAPIWRPNQLFRITMDIMDRVTNPSGGTVAHNGVFSLGFKTEGPLGFYHASNLPVSETPVPDGADTSLANAFDDTQVQAPEMQLKYYVDDLRSYPDPTGKILYAKPLYFEGSQIDLVLKNPFAYHFFSHWPAYQGLAEEHYEMDIQVVDPAQTDATNLPSHTQPVTRLNERSSANVEWVVDTQVLLGQNLYILQNLRAAADELADPCWNNSPLDPAAKKVEAALSNLKPLKTYTAIIRNKNVTDATAKIVMRYPFTTSRYPSFGAHVHSYQRTYKDETGEAFFVYDVSLDSAQIDRAKTVVSNGEADPDTQYRDAYDSVVFGIFGILDIDPTNGTEVNFIRDDTLDKPIAVWVRSDEPFNDPRLSNDELSGSIQWLYNGNISGETAVLFSKDRCEFVIMRTDASTVQMQNTALSFGRFEWSDGALIETQRIDVPVAYQTVLAESIQ